MSNSSYFKRIFDLTVGTPIFLLVSPFLGIIIFLVWINDRESPFYVSDRIGIGGKTFRMVKLRSMVVGADKIGGDAAHEEDPRITRVGHIIRRYKLDEFMQLWNVIRGDMSLVGPRPNVWGGTVLYTEEEKKLLSVKPGITDLASIVFSDLDTILKGSSDPDLDYNQLVRPWKSRLGLFYIDNQSFILDLTILFLTALSLISRSTALTALSALLKKMGANNELINVAIRDTPLSPTPPPGSDIIETRVGSRMQPGRRYGNM